MLLATSLVSGLGGCLSVFPGGAMCVLMMLFLLKTCNFKFTSIQSPVHRHSFIFHSLLASQALSNLWP